MRHDIIYAVRVLLKSGGAAAVAVLTLAFGIVLNTAAFSTCNAIWFRPLPFADSDRLAVLAGINVKKGHVRPVSYAGFQRWRENARQFEAIAALSEAGANLGGKSSGFEPRYVRTAAVSAGFIETLGFRPIRGRLFLASDFEPGAPRVALIGETLWRSVFGARPEIVGTEILLDGRKTMVAGVLPLGFRFLFGGYQIVTPLGVDPVPPHSLQVLAKLRPGVTVQAAQSEMASLAPEEAAGDPEWSVRVSYVKDEWMRDARGMYPILLAAAVLVLLIVCANISNVMLARAARRQREMAVRVALGAGRTRLLRQMLTEGVVLALSGAAVALPLCAWLRSALVAAYPELSDLTIDWRVLSYTLSIAAGAGLLFQAGPALAAAATDVNEALKGVRTGGRGTRLRKALVVCEMAVAILMLGGSGLLVKSIVQLKRADAGFREDGLITARVSLASPRYRDGKARADFVSRAASALGEMPGIQSASAVAMPPLLGGPSRVSVEVEGRDGGVPLRAAVNATTPRYFETIGTSIRQGREIAASDTGGSRRVAVINTALAGVLWPDGKDVTGQRIRLNGGEWLEVTGVAQDIRQDLMRPAIPEIFTAAAQDCPAGMVFMVRTGMGRQAAGAAVRDVVRSLDPDLPVSGVQTVEEIKEGYFPRVMLFGLGGFSGLALALAAIGLYGVVSCLVTQRAREVGIRVALGARRREVVASFLWDGARLAAIGGAIGLAGSFAVGRVLARFLVGVHAADPAVFLGVTVILALVALAASVAPAWQAVRIDPVTALRQE